MKYYSKRQLNQHHKQPVKDKSRVICPLTFHATDGRTATNYTVDWASTIELIELDSTGRVIRREVGCWRSQAKNRAFEPEFRKALAHLKDQGLVTWDEDSYFFFDEDGVACALEYVDLVVRGELRAHARSWRGRFEKIAGVSIEELKEDYPHIYGYSGTQNHSMDEVQLNDSEVQDGPAAQATAMDLGTEAEVTVVSDNEGRLTVIGGPDEEGSDWLNSEPRETELLEIEKEASYEEKT